MPNIVNVHMDPTSLERVFKGNQICLLHQQQQCLVGDIFFLEYLGERKYFKMLDIWSSPKDFVIKFLWRLSGVQDLEELKIKLEQDKDNMIFAHIFSQISWNDVQNLVKL
jgi:hypothetical protein